MRIIDNCRITFIFDLYKPKSDYIASLYGSFLRIITDLILDPKQDLHTLRIIDNCHITFIFDLYKPKSDYIASWYDSFLRIITDLFLDMKQDLNSLLIKDNGRITLFFIYINQNQIILLPDMILNSESSLIYF